MEHMRSIINSDTDGKGPSPSQHGPRLTIFLPSPSSCKAIRKEVNPEMLPSTEVLRLHCTRRSSTEFEIRARFNEALCTSPQAERLLDQFAFIMRQLVTRPKVQDLSTTDLLPSSDRTQLLAWNNAARACEIKECLHQQFMSRALENGGGIAAVTTDSILTYAELDDQSSRLAAHLTSRYTIQGAVVPILFEKSNWAIVSILAVLKAGGACACMCVSHPNQYLSRITTRVQAPVVLASPAQAPRLRETNGAPLEVVFSETLAALPMCSESWRPAKTKPEDIAFVLSTSGSTGQPKGILLSHRALATTIAHHGRASRVGAQPRTVQFSSYAFDMAIYDIFHALTRGGTVCTPSEQERLDDLAAFVQRHKVTWAFFTPTVLRNYRPADFPCIETIGVGGEVVGTDLVRLWGTRLQIMYGPSEVTPCAVGPVNPEGWIPGTIGFPVGCCGWITRPDDVQQLASIGAVGELLIEGPIVANGYLNEPTKSREAFIPAPSWRATFPIPLRGPFFRTNDLVQYNDDGSMRFVSRKDATKKINGQRVDIDAIEYVLREMEPSYDIAVETARLTGTRTDEALVAFLSPKSATKSRWSDKCLQSFPQADAVCKKLGQRLPRYMVPKFIILVPQMPTTPTGKIDKKKMLASVARYSHSELAQLPGDHTRGSVAGRPTTSREIQLSKLVASITGLPMESIDMDQGFIHTGGDSLTALQLVTLARQNEIHLSVTDLLRPEVTLRKLCLQTSSPNQQELLAAPVPGPFVLLGTEIHELQQLARQQCGISATEIEDIYPCTPIQEALLVTIETQSEAYMDRFIFKLPPSTDLSRVVDAWNQVVACTSILRTRLIRSASGCFQVVTRPTPLPLHRYSSQEQYMAEDAAMTTGIGTALVRFSSIQGRKNGTDCEQFALSIHHAVYDGWSMGRMLQRAESAYAGIALDHSPFSHFVQHLQSTDQTQEALFWRSKFSRVDAVIFPEPPIKTTTISHASAHLSYQHSGHLQRSGGFTAATRIYLAWALLLSLYTNRADVVYGISSNGRMASLPGIHDVIGPTLATIPLHTRVDLTMPVRQALETLQSTVVDTIPFEHTGVHRIAQLSPEARKACAFQNLVVIQPPDSMVDSKLFGSCEQRLGVAGHYPGYPLVLLCSPMSDNQWQLEFLLDEQVMSRLEGERLLRQFSHLLSQVNDQQEPPLGQLQWLSEMDECQLRDQSSHTLSMPPTTIHGMISEHVKMRATETAVCGWDGEFTYKEIDFLSTKVARELNMVGIRRGTTVPIWLERSRWVVVAMIGVMKSGAAFVLLDQDAPQQRNLDICTAVQAKWIVASRHGMQTSRNLARMVYVVGDQEIAADNSQQHYEESVLPDDLLYVVFTSGSTGKPKGVEIEHTSYCAAVLAQRRALHIGTGTRVLQLSSYAFDSFAVEILTTLASGGCVCIPSDQEIANGLGHAIERYGAEWMCTTPSVLRLLSPDAAPCLKTVVAVGESMLPSQVALWQPHVRLLCGYGPSECCTGAAVHPIQTAETDPRIIGTGMGCALWVVHPDDHDVLLPLGAVGELLIQGPIVGRGYLNDPEKTKCAFLETTTWASSFLPAGSPGRFYKTGDLVRMNADGTCLFLGRKDLQVKLRGQRLDIPEVERHLREALGGVGRVVMADLIRPGGASDAHPTLVAMIQMSGEPVCAGDSSVNFGSCSTEMVHRMRDAEERMMATLPSVMIPSFWLQVDQMPLTISGKIDRRKIRSAASALTGDELAALNCLRRRDTAASLDATEQTAWEISQLTFEILSKRFDADSSQVVGQDVTLSRLGLDSIDMMALSQAINTRFHVRISIRDLSRTALSVRALARLVAAAPEGAIKQEEKETFELRKEVQSLCARVDCINDSAKQKTKQSSARSLRHRRVFLTGATGFLGTHILKGLVEDPRVGHVTVLVRSQSDEVAIAQLVAAARIARWWKEQYRSMITVWRGCLSKPRLGLSAHQWNILAGSEWPQGFDAVIHSGAVVHWGQDYQSLKEVNVMSTLRIVEALSIADHPVAFTYVSALLPSTNGTETDDEVLDQLSQADGYSKTKFVSEVIIRRAIQHVGCQHIRASIVRPGFIIGSTEAGVANIGDYLWRVVGSAIACGLYNKDDKEDSLIFLSPADLVASLVIRACISFGGAPGPSASSADPVISIRNGLSVRDFWDAVKLGCPFPLQPCDGQRWLQTVREDMNRAGKTHPLWPVFHFLEIDNGCIGFPQAQEDGQCHCNWQCPMMVSILQSTVVKNIQYLLSVGYVDEQTRQLNGQPPDTFRRGVL
ncbi:hypothetical protein CDV55_105077 [Aspergillus turcosus]|nr:hypothetical protein CDV55_105077 [Aspergillus turcosus]